MVSSNLIILTWWTTQLRQHRKVLFFLLLELFSFFFVQSLSCFLSAQNKFEFISNCCIISSNIDVKVNAILKSELVLMVWDEFSINKDFCCKVYKRFILLVFRCTMASTKLILSFFMLLVPALIQCKSTCLHNGCEMSAGIKMADINTTIHENLKEDANIDNVVTALSWDLGQVLPGDENNKEMCAILNKMDPTVCHFKMDYKSSTLYNR